MNEEQAELLDPQITQQDLESVALTLLTYQTKDLVKFANNFSSMAEDSPTAKGVYQSFSKIAKFPNNWDSLLLDDRIALLSAYTNRIEEANVKSATQEFYRNYFTENFVTTLKNGTSMRQIRTEAEIFDILAWRKFIRDIVKLNKSDCSFREKLQIRPIQLGVEDTKAHKLKDIPDIEDVKSPYIFGVTELDELVNLKRGNFCVVAARASVGKSLLMIQSAVTNAHNGYRVLYVSLEENEQEIKKRVNNVKTYMGYSMENIGENFTLYSPESSNIQFLMGKIDELNEENSFDIIYIDYLQLLSATNETNSYMALKQITRELKVYASSKEIVMMTASQLNREADVMGGALTNLTGSSTIEADANTVVMLEPERTGTVRIGDDVPLRVKIAKNRSGRQGQLKCMCDYSKGVIRAAEN